MDSSLCGRHYNATSLGWCHWLNHRYVWSAEAKLNSAGDSSFVLQNIWTGWNVLNSSVIVTTHLHIRFRRVSYLKFSVLSGRKHACWGALSLGVTAGEARERRLTECHRLWRVLHRDLFNNISPAVGHVFLSHGQMSAGNWLRTLLQIHRAIFASFNIAALFAHCWISQLLLIQIQCCRIWNSK